MQHCNCRMNALHLSHSNLARLVPCITQFIPYCILLLAFAATTRSTLRAQYVDNMPGLNYGGLGLSPAASADSNLETVNLTNGELSAFIPAVTLKQRDGSHPLVLGFTYNSTQLYIRQDVDDTTMMMGGSGNNPGPNNDIYYYYYNPTTGESSLSVTEVDETPAYSSPYLPANNISGLVDLSNEYYYDSYSYDYELTPLPYFYPQPLQVNLPMLKASIEYEGDAYSNIDEGGTQVGFSTIPVVCVTNFTFTDWQGSVHPFTFPFPATSECNQEANGYAGGVLRRSAYHGIVR